MDIAHLRLHYAQGSLTESDVAPDPLNQFRLWLDQAMSAELREPYAMTLATATPDGAPSARVVLLRGFDERGFAFYTNYDSRKGDDLAANPRAALVFYWAELERQVRIEGPVSKVTDAESDAYFQARPRGHRLGAWVSEQSRVIAGRAELEQELAAVEARYPDEDVPRPPHWGGYRVVPSQVEFWQGRPNRLHDRLRYRTAEGGGWIVERLAP
jgi:pyridoxamine 5'-phosphate oxidase